MLLWAVFFALAYLIVHLPTLCYLIIVGVLAGLSCLPSSQHQEPWRVEEKAATRSPLSLLLPLEDTPLSANK